MEANKVPNYQSVILIPTNDWENVISRLEIVESAINGKQDPVPVSDDEYFDSDSTSKILGLHKNSLYRCVSYGKIKARKVNGREYEFSVSEIKRYMGNKPRYRDVVI